MYKFDFLMHIDNAILNVVRENLDHVTKSKEFVTLVLDFSYMYVMPEQYNTLCP